MKKLLAIVAVSILLGACSAPKGIVDYKTDTVWKTKTEYVNQVLRDSVIVRDSVYVRATGDTIYEYRYRDKWHIFHTHDTINSIDTVYVAKNHQSEKVVEKKEPFFKFFIRLVVIATLFWTAIDLIGRLINKLFHKKYDK